jgi:hypothetical protein
VAIGDFKRDGFRDLATANRDPISGAPTLSVLLNNGEGAFPNGHKDSDLPFSIPSSAVTGDFNHDGFVDLALGLSGSVDVFLGNEDGTFRSPTVIQFGEDDVFGLVAGDFNHDGILDLAAVDEFPEVFVLIGNGDGTFQPPVSYTVGDTPLNLVTGDFNGDGVLDLVASHNPDPSGSKQILSILIGIGDGTFQAAKDFGPEEFLTSHILGAADFDGNGTLDLLFGNAVLLGKGDGTFANPIPFNGGVLTIGDFDGDGKPDVAVIHSASNEVEVHFGNGDGTFQAATIVAVGEGPSSITSGKLATPNHDDIVVTNATGNTVSVLRFQKTAAP